MNKNLNIKSKIPSSGIWRRADIVLKSAILSDVYGEQADSIQ
jgi:hypothetical protein